MRAVLIGATGLVGGQCLRRLLEDARTEKVVVFARRKNAAPHPKLDWRVVEMSDPPDFSADEFYCCLGTTMKRAGSREAFRRVDLEIPLAWALAACAGGAPRTALVSSVGADVESANFYLSVKGEVERAFSDLRFPYLGIFRPSLLLGERRETRPFEGLGRAAACAASAFLWGPLSKYRPIAAEEIAAGLVRAVRSPDRGIHAYEYDAIRRLTR